jgi:hypothetical protein
MQLGHPWDRPSAFVSHFQVVMQDCVRRSYGNANIWGDLFNSQWTISQNNFLHSLDLVNSPTCARPRFSWFVVASHPRTNIRHIHDSITECFDQLAMNFNWCLNTQMQKMSGRFIFCIFLHSIIYTLLLGRKRRHFEVSKTILTLTAMELVLSSLAHICKMYSLILKQMPLIPVIRKH